MDCKKIEEALEKQLQLLSERSGSLNEKDCDGLMKLTQSMCLVVNTIDHLIGRNRSQSKPQFPFGKIHIRSEHTGFGEAYEPSLCEASDNCDGGRD